MADRFEWYDITIPANTPIANPATFPMVFLFGTVVEINVKVLSGPGGAMGFFIAAGGTQYVPRTAGHFVRPDDDYMVWPISNAINSGSWALTGYNTDVFDHSVQVGFHVNEIGGMQVVAQGQLGFASQTLDQQLALIPPQPPAAPDPLSPAVLIPSAQAYIKRHKPITVAKRVTLQRKV